MTIKRETLKFLIPISVFGIKSSTLDGRKVIPFYISPNSVKINEHKLMTETLTKGGYYIEYWGEKLPSVSVSGTTGSGGIEAIEILRSVYRNEQIQMEKLLLERARNLREDSTAALSDSSDATLLDGIISSIDALTENSFSEVLNGSSSVIDNMKNIFNQQSTVSNATELIPSLGTFAVSVDLYMQGLKFRGYFESFNYSEVADSAGLFDYDFIFKVLRRTGTRKNFMPWHRNPYDSNRNPTVASIPIEGPRIDELSYESNLLQQNQITQEQVTSTFFNNQIGTADINDIDISRFKKAQS